jgi:hypothetical protein
MLLLPLLEVGYWAARLLLPFTAHVVQFHAAKMGTRESIACWTVRFRPVSPKSESRISKFRHAGWRDQLCGQLESQVCVLPPRIP